MAENKTGGNGQFSAAVEALFQGMDHLVATKTVVGDAVRVDDAIILPLMDVTCGMGAIKMEIAGKAEDFDYEVEGALGEITVNGVLMEGKHEWRNNAEKQMELICSMGAIEVTFYENGGNEYE